MRLVLPCAIVLWSVPCTLALRVDAASVLVPPLRSTAILASVIAVCCIAGLRWGSIYARRRHVRITSIVRTRYSLDGVLALGAFSTGGVFFTCWAVGGHTLADALVVVLALALGATGIGFVAQQHRVVAQHAIIPIALAFASAAITASFALRPSLVGGTLIPAMLATLALLGWDGVYVRAIAEIRAELQATRIPAPPERKKVISFSRPGSPDPPSAA